MLFSERLGLTPVRKAIQVDSMDEGLRNKLWNMLDMHFWYKTRRYNFLTDCTELYPLARRLTHQYFKTTFDTLPTSPGDYLEQLREYFFSCKWYEVYDFLEFTCAGYGVNTSSDSNKEDFQKHCNRVLEEEVSGYRFLKGTLVPITSMEEVSEIENALKASAGLCPNVEVHLKQALALLADKTAPDYRNSIKESISAVESVSCWICDTPGATLGQALKKIERDKSVDLHPSLKGAFEKLYGYTSDAEGIRHAITEEQNLQQEDARFMLIACSAFVNYLLSKSTR